MGIEALSFSNIYNSFKNNDFKTGSFTMSGVIAPSAFASFSTTITLDRVDSVTELYFSTSVNSVYHSIGNLYLALPGMTIDHDNGSTPSSPGTASYTTFFSVGYSGTSMTITANMLNPYIDNLTIVNETLGFQVYTFIAPFAA